MKDFFLGKKVLIFGGTSSTRAYLRTLFKELGVEGTAVSTAMEFAQANENLHSLKPEILFLDYKVERKTALPLIRDHITIYPNRYDTLILTMGLPGISPDHASSKDLGSDIFLCKPISQELIIRSIENWYEYRKSKSDELKILCSAKEKFFQEDYSTAVKIVDSALSKGFQEPGFYFLKGSIQEKSGNEDGALESFLKGLEVEKNHYFCQKAVYQIFNKRKQYAKAFEHISPFIKKHPIDPIEIPEITKSFIAREKFEEFIDFCEKYVSLDNFDLMKSETETRENGELFGETSHKIAICLLACGRFLNKQGNIQKAKKSLVQASALCGSSGMKLLGQIANELLDMKETKELDKIFKRIPDQLMDAELHTIKFLLDLEIYNDAEALKLGLELVKEGIKDHRIYDQIIIRSIRLKRRSQFIEDLVQDAICNFPDQADYFKKFMRKSA